MRLKFLLLPFAAVAFTAFAEEKEWIMETDTGETVIVEDVVNLKENGGADNFNITLKDGTEILDVGKVTFAERTVDDGVSTLGAPDLNLRFDGDILMMENLGAGTLVEIFTLDGRKETEASANPDGSVRVDISGLRNDAYVLKAGGFSIKFIHP